jgi:signal transduction histidine kinase
VVFAPLRERVQDGVDRRFRRAQYDARQRMVRFYDALRRGDLPPEGVQGVLRDVLDDPDLTILYSLPGSQDYVDVTGTVVQTVAGDLPVEWNGHRVGVVRCGPLGNEATHLARDVVPSAGLAIEMSRLRVELREKLTEVQASRARIVAAAQEERRRIERDLHDGAQQRLVSVGLGLRHVQHRLAARPGDPVRTALDDAVAEVAAAIEELRSLAHGIVPRQLDAGLAPAFRELARRSPVPVLVHACDERFPEGVEAAAYFFGCEAVTNAVKHASASRIELTATRRDGRLVVSVCDDGTGRAHLDSGSGLRGLADRVAALGGTMVLDSAGGRGTMLTAELPCGS